MFMLFAQDHAQEAVVNRQRTVARIIDKAHRQELVCEMTYPRPRGPNHLRQVLVLMLERIVSARLSFPKYTRCKRIRANRFSLELKSR